MTRRVTRILDASALVALFAAHPEVFELLDRAERGEVLLLVPASAIAQAETELNAGPNEYRGHRVPLVVVSDP